MTINSSHQSSSFVAVAFERMALRTLQECQYLRNVLLNSTPSMPTQREEWESLEAEVCWSNVQLNGLLFNGSAGSQVLKVLRALCQELTKGLRLSSESIYLSMVVRLASSSNNADSYLSLNSLLGSQDLVLKQPKEKKGPANDDIPPADLALYEAGEQIHAVLTTYTAYGLFRRNDHNLGKPWISLLAQVHERVNLSTGESVRQVGVQITTPEF